MFTDAAFANNEDLSSQIGYIIALANVTQTDQSIHMQTNIVHWSSTKCKRVTRSVLAAELYAMAEGFDTAVAIATTLKMILRRQVPLSIYTDSKSLFECLVKLGTTKEKRLMIDILCLRQAYERRQITEVTWIEGASNPADALTKAKSSKALESMIEANEVIVKTMAWVERNHEMSSEEEIKKG